MHPLGNSECAIVDSFVLADRTLVGRLGVVVRFTGTKSYDDGERSGYRFVDDGKHPVQQNNKKQLSC